MPPPNANRPCVVCSDSEAKKKEETPKDDKHRPGFGRGYFAADAASSTFKTDDAKAPAAAVVSFEEAFSPCSISNVDVHTRPVHAYCNMCPSLF